MADRGPRLPPSLVALILGVTGVPLLALGWFGLELLGQDRSLESQQTRQRVERGADLAVTAIGSAIAGWEQRLTQVAADWREPAAVLRFEGAAMEIRSVPPLAFSPEAARLPEAPARVFAAAEALEFQARDLRAAGAAYRRLAARGDPAVRAGALGRLGRVLKAQGRHADAEAAFAALAGEDAVAVHGIPASLLSAYALGRALEASGADDRLREHGTRFGGDLRSGRWRLTSDLYALYAADARRWAPPQPETPADWAEVLAEAVEQVHARWASGEARGSAARERAVLEVRGQRLTVVGTTTGQARAYLIASPAFVEAHWTSAAGPVASEHGITLKLGEDAPMPAGSRIVATRTAAATGLPWTLEAASVEPAPERAAFARRRRWLVSGLALFGLLAASASYLIFRAVSREVALARLQSDFVAAVSHEFRTPLTALRQFTEMLVEQPALGDERRRQAYDAQLRATDRLSRLVESLLDFGRLRAGAARYRREPQDLTRLVERVVEEFRPEAARTGHSVALSAAEPVRVTGDEGAIAIAVRNLLDNAVKYSPVPHAVEVVVGRTNGDARVAVADKGLGIPPDERETIFERFRRGEQAHHLGIRGTGIGLALVAEIAHAHGGRVEVRSQPGAGSTFTLVLPAGA